MKVIIVVKILVVLIMKTVTLLHTNRQGSEYPVSSAWDRAWQRHKASRFYLGDKLGKLVSCLHNAFLLRVVNAARK